MAPALPLPRGLLPAAILDQLHRRDAPPQSQPGTHVAAIAERLAALSNSLSSRLPTRTILDIPSRVMAARRDTTTETVPGQYHNLNSGPDPGTVVGIVLGSVGGFLLLLWLFYTCMNFGVPPDAASDIGTASVVTRRSRKSHRHHHHRASGGRETVEIRRSSRGPAVIVEEASRDRVVVEEVRRSTSRAPPAPPPPRVVHSDDDEVVVIEEHDPPRRHRSKGHRRHSSSRRESGYRDIDPDRFAGGDAPMRDIRGSSRHGR
ncbi:hypothetical protein UCRPA7_490 [Phaeoacremonium minimum UCRPA7]|uniref:Uncharacterized protein n=1 Tax=Phaeoacremonium minimum (strain UCR-PA7) TaxID=1286976 RepID=R8BWL7_PHAM7|nr:hypothetical protein UCRPA7_490 [Phaeoacremonium minimum UCRPA7]EOO03761.1 hypothetical protein UCRPA7_490 [Phaeoacremonium minimum UCRPA7]